MSTVDVLCRYVASATQCELPPEVREKGAEHLLDTLAAMVSGSRLHPGHAAIAYARSQGGAAQATVVGSDVVTTATNAGQANGMLAHADETDDSHRASRTHPGCGIVAAALAAAEWRGRSGAELLRAVVLGYDVGPRATMSFGGEGTYLTSRLATHSIGSLFGAGAAAGALAGFSPNNCAGTGRGSPSRCRGSTAGCAIATTCSKPSSSAAWRPVTRLRPRRWWRAA